MFHQFVFIFGSTFPKQFYFSSCFTVRHLETKTDVWVKTKSDTNISASLFLTQIYLQSSQLISHHAVLDLVLCLGLQLYVFQNVQCYWYFID